MHDVGLVVVGGGGGDLHGLFGELGGGGGRVHVGDDGVHQHGHTGGRGVDAHFDGDAHDHGPNVPSSPFLSESYPWT